MLEESATLPPSGTNYRCQQCNLYQSCRTPFLPAVGKKYSKLLLVSIAPEECDDQETQQVFTGPLGRLVKQEILKPLGLSAKETAFVSAVRCFPTNTKQKPTAAQVSLCSAFLAQDIKRLKPKGVVCLGPDVAKAVLQTKSVTVKEMIAQVAMSPQGVNTIVTYNPLAVLAKMSRGYIMAIKKMVEFFLRGATQKPFPKMKVLT